MKERPILFSAPMVRAILDARKTQTRRLVKKPSVIGIVENGGQPGYQLCPYGAPGDRLWVRETWQLFDPHPDADGDLFVVGADRMARGRRAPYVGVVNDRPIEWTACYRADGELAHPTHGEARWKPGIHMPRWASRITLEITDVRVERLHDISRDDAIAEGARRFDDIPDPHPYGQGSRWSCEDPPNTEHCLGSPQMAFANLWSRINGAESWDANPWVWVVSFKRAEAAAKAA
jgi:hypothetical protein